jgi:hypothetical protein
MAPGAALVLLLTGPATNLASAFVISKQLGRIGTATYFGGIAVGSLLAGSMVQWLAPAWNLGAVDLSTEALPFWLGAASAVLLLVAIVSPWLVNRMRRAPAHTQQSAEAPRRDRHERLHH